MYRQKLALCLVVISMIGLGSVAFAQTVDEAAVVQAQTAGGARLRALQQPNGEWYFDADLTHCYQGEGVTCPNTIGVTALGLYAAYTRTGDPLLLQAMTAAGNALVTRFAAAPTSAPYSQDVEFLVALSQASGNPLYATTALSWFNAGVAQFASVDARVQAKFTSRNNSGFGSAVAWDMASLIRAAKAVGNPTYAQDVGASVIAIETLWKDMNPAHQGGNGLPGNIYSYDFTIVGTGSLLWAIHDLPGFDVSISEYRDFLIANQDADGSWDAGDSQFTAYVLVGLAAVGGADDAMLAAAGFYIANQNASGGWPGWISPDGNGPENVEVDGEVVRALATLFNTPLGGDIAVRPAQLSSLTFSSVNSSGRSNVVAQELPASTSVPGGFEVYNGLTYEVATTATFSGGAVVCFSIPWIGDAATFANARVLHNEGGVLVDRTILTGAFAPNFATRRACANVTSFSAFAVALRKTVVKPDVKAPKLSVKLTPSVLTPADNRMVTLVATIKVTDDTDPSPKITLVSITSTDDDDDDDYGCHDRRHRRDCDDRHDRDGRKKKNKIDRKADIQDAVFGTDDRTFKLRAEKPDSRAGIIYTIVYRATDRAGNKTEVSAQVIVRR